MIKAIQFYLMLLLFILISNHVLAQTKLTVDVIDTTSYPFGEQGRGCIYEMTTLNPALNKLFTTNHVTIFTPAYPSVYREDASPDLAELKKAYLVVCDCDTTTLKKLRDTINADTILFGISQALIYYDPVFPGIPDLADADLPKIYPNPVTDKITLEGVNNHTLITITNVLGRVVYSEYNTHTVDVNKLGKGIHYISVSNEQGLVFTQKIVIY